MCFVDEDLINESVDVISLQEGPRHDLWEYRRYRPKSLKIYGTDTERYLAIPDSRQSSFEVSSEGRGMERLPACQLS